MTFARDIITRFARSVYAIGSGIVRKVSDGSAAIRRRIFNLWRHQRTPHAPRNTFRRKLVRGCFAAWVAMLVAAPAAATVIDNAFTRWLLTNADDLMVATATVPVIVLTPVYAENGYAPLHCVWRIDTDNSTIGAGDWHTCRVEWQVQVNTTTPTTRDSIANPHTGATMYLDTSQPGFNCNYIFRDAGTGRARCRVTNEAGERCEWMYTSSVTITAEGSRPAACYVDGARADNTGDGLSWAAAKKDFDDGIGVLAGLADGAVMYCRTCNVTATTDGGGENKYVRADPDAVGDVVCTFTGTFTAVNCTATTAGWVVGKGLKFTNASGDGKVMGHNNTTVYGNCLYDMRVGFIEDISNASGSSSSIKGFSHILVSETSTDATDAFTGEAYFSNDTEGFLSWGCDFAVGGSVEHTYRLGGGPARVAAYHTYVAGDLGSLVKAGIREYSNGFCVFSDCICRRVWSLGGVSPGSDLDKSGQYFVYERVHFRQIAGQSGERYLLLNSAWTHISVRSCYFNDMSLFATPRTDEDVTHFLTDVNVLHNTFYRGDAAIRFGGTGASELTNNPDRLKIRNNLFVHTGSMTSTQTYIQLQDAANLTGCAVEGNHVLSASATDKFFRNHTTGDTYDMATAESTFAYVDNNARSAAITYDGTTLEPTAGLTTGVSGVPHVFVSFNGVQYDYSDANYPAGAWLSSAAAGEYPEYLYYNIGNLLIKVVA